MNTPFASTTLAAQAILAGGTDVHKSEILPQIATGHAATVALSEKNGDWDLANISAKAVKTENGYRLSGTKVFVMNLQSANWIIASVLLFDQPSLIILSESDIEEIRAEKLIDETKRGHEIILDGIEISGSQLMDTDISEQACQHIHLVANLLSAAELTGGCKSVIDYTVEYLKTRRQFGKLIGSYQALKHPTVDAFVDYEKARSLLYAAAYSFGEQGTGEIATRMAKVGATEALSFAADRSIQFHGGFGFTYDCDAQLYRRRAIFNASQYGDAAYHRAKLADLLL